MGTIAWKTVIKSHNDELCPAFMHSYLQSALSSSKTRKRWVTKQKSRSCKRPTPQQNHNRGDDNVTNCSMSQGKGNKCLEELYIYIAIVISLKYVQKGYTRLRIFVCCRTDTNFSPRLKYRTKCMLRWQIISLSQFWPYDWCLRKC